MYTIEELPCEVVAAILSNLGSLQDLANATLVCRHIYDSFKEVPSAAGDIVLSFFDPDMLPLAVAAERVSTLPEPRTARMVRDFVDSVTRDDRTLVSQTRSMSLQSLYSMLSTESAIIDFAFSMAERSWKAWDLRNNRPVGLSIAEASRFFRAFYRTEIFFMAFRTSSEDPDPEVVRQSQLWLLTSFAQFEVEQIACVHDYLERRLLKAGNVVFAHDIEFGARQVDYCTLGNNPWVQRWISQGIAFVSKLTKSHHDAKRALLAGTIYTDVAPLWEALEGQHEMCRDNKAIAVSRPRHNFDSDSGPPSAFDFANMVMLEDEEPMEDPVLSTVAEIDRGLREQAYVLWDMARLKDWDLWSLIEEAPETSTNFPSRREIDEMGRSWRVRADAKREGLQGWLSGRPKLIKRNDRSARRS